MRAAYGMPLRGVLLHEAPPRLIVDFGELPVFEAGVDPAVFLVEKAGGHKKLKAAAIKTKAEIDDLKTCARTARFFHARFQPFSILSGL